MAPRSRPNRAAGQRSVKVVTANPNEISTIIHQAISRRAYQIFESRGREPGHDLDDWRQAESEVLRPLCCGSLDLHDRITLTVDASCFEKGEVEIHVEPHFLAISGKACPCKATNLSDTTPQGLRGQMIFLARNLPVDIIPTGVKAWFKGPILEVSLPKARARQDVFPEAKAA